MQKSRPCLFPTAKHSPAWAGTHVFTIKWVASILILYLAGMMEKEAYIFSEYCSFSSCNSSGTSMYIISFNPQDSGEEGSSSTPSGGSRVSHGRAGS